MHFVRGFHGVALKMEESEAKFEKIERTIPNKVPMATKPEARSEVMDIRFSTNKLKSTHILALDALMEYQCKQLEKKLNDLNMKRQQLHSGGSVTVSLEEIISDNLVDVAEVVVAPRRGDTSRTRSFEERTEPRSSEDVREIIASINNRKAIEEDRQGLNRRVQFTANDNSHYNPFKRMPQRRSTTLPEKRSEATATGEVQRMLHIQGNCKPCAFFYNKNRGCRNGESCGFCHHEEHSAFSVKQWKKTQKSGSMLEGGICEPSVEANSPNENPQ